MQPRIPILLIDVARLTRDSLSSLLQEKAPDFRIDAVPDCDAAAGWPLVPALLLFNAKDADIADVPLRDGIARLAGLWPDTPRLMISERRDQRLMALEAIQSGWRGFFPASLKVELLLAAIRLVLSEGIFIPPAVVQQCAALLAPMPRNSLSLQGLPGHGSWS